MALLLLNVYIAVPVPMHALDQVNAPNQIHAPSQITMEHRERQNSEPSP